MKSSSHKQSDHPFHPYMFVLKEGKHIQQNFLDYSLLLLHTGEPDVIPSPFKSKKTSTPIVQMLKRIN